MNSSTLLSVVGQLSGKQIFITGVTGFLGKTILEKLLREVPDIDQIYILARGSNTHTAQERCLSGVFGSSLFNTLKLQYGEQFGSFIQSKVSVIEGELTEPLFGLKSTEFESIANKLDLVINSAASVNFREAMDQALQINTLSLNNIIALANYSGQFNKATPVIQVSTCYVNGFNQGSILEEIMGSASGLINPIGDGTFDVASVIASIQEKIDLIASRFECVEGGRKNAKYEEALIQLGISESRHYGWNDTYTFTKWMGEQLLLQGLGQQNLTILRPSIIESTVSSPVAGWVEGVKVADALIYAYAKGRVNIFPGDDTGVLDVIPVDLVANAALLSAAELLNDGEGFRLYQCCSGSTNPIVLKDFINYLTTASKEQYHALPKLFSGKPNDSFKTVSTRKFGLYMTALKGFTWIKTVSGRVLGSNSASKLMAKVNTTASLAVIFGFYSAAKYQFDSRKLQGLQEQFSKEDQLIFNTNANCYGWEHYLKNIHLPGLHKYALADKPSLVKTAIEKQSKKKEPHKKAA
jgi:thioester reductase-like protein